MKGGIHGRSVYCSEFSHDEPSKKNGLREVLIILTTRKCRYARNGSVEFLVSGKEIKNLRLDEGRGQYLSPRAAPALKAMMTHYLFRSYRIFGGAQSGKTTVIDYIGNYVREGAVIDVFAGFGQPGDTPVAGKWS